MRRALLPGRAAILGGLTATVLLLTAATRYLWIALPPTAVLLGNGWAASAYRGVADLPSAIEPVRLDGIRVHVLRAAATERFTTPGFYARELQHWRELLAELGAVAASAADADVLVVPHGLCLDDDARATLTQHVARGRGVLTTGMLGSHDGGCQPAADTLLVDWLGGPGNASPLRQTRPGSYYAAVLGGTALGANLPPGARVELMPAGQIVFRGEDRDVFYADFVRAPAPLDGEPYFDGAIARSLVGAGRLAAFGFALDHVVPGWSTMIARGVAANALRWAAGEPVVEIAPWPGAARAAVAFAQDVEHEFANGLPAAKLLAGIGVPVASYLLGSEAAEHAEMSRALAALGETGSHTVDHRALDRLSRRAQIRQLAWAQRQMRQLVGTTSAGLRPPEERFDAATLLAWRAVGGEYVFAANDARAASPELVPLDGDTIVLLPRGTIDDFQLLVAEGVRDRGELARRLLHELDVSAATRGLHMFSFHSHLLARPELQPVLAALARAALADSTLWLAQPHEIAHWWQARARVALRVDRESGTLKVSNEGSATLADAVLTVHLADGTQQQVPLPPLAAGAQLELAAPVMTPAAAGVARAAVVPAAAAATGAQ